MLEVKKCWHDLLQADAINFFATSKCQKKKKKKTENRWKSMKIANIDREILHNFWRTWGISMKFSRKIWLTILKITKN